MSKQKKKKPNSEAQQKLLLAQNRKEYIRKIQWFCSLLGGNQYFKLLEKHLDALFHIRPKALKIIPCDDKIPKEFFETVKIHLNAYLDEMTSEIFEGGPAISYRDWIFVMIPVQSLLNLRSNVRDADGIFEKLLEKHQDRCADIMLKIIHKAEYIGLICSDFSEIFFQVKYSFAIAKDGNKARLSNTVTIISAPPNWRQIRVGNGKRTAARVGWGFSDSVHWMSVQLSQLGIKTKGADQPMDVYMQQHALNRMRERIGGLYADVMNTDIALSFFEIKAFPTGGGNFLIEHRVKDLKAGYFVATFTDDVLLIRTFLFITHIGTPEGRKLASITGLGKLDQKYLAFDNLLTLANSDVLSNDEAKEIFINAGCSELLELCQLIRSLKTFWDISEQEKPLAEKLLKYIKAGKEEISDEILDFWADME